MNDQPASFASDVQLGSIDGDGAGHFAHTTNAGRGSIGMFAVTHDGSLNLLRTTAVGTGSHPLDDAVSRDQQLLRVLVDGFHQIAEYRVGHDGSLTAVRSVAVPAGAIGAPTR